MVVGQKDTFSNGESFCSLRIFGRNPFCKARLDESKGIPDDYPDSRKMLVRIPAGVYIAFKRSRPWRSPGRHCSDPVQFLSSFGIKSLLNLSKFGANWGCSWACKLHLICAEFSSI